ncbi:methyl-accepting chemotaxis protein [Inhella proteolytica]|uniref:HAMP domain-containing protein n=1 Tax=Inhella proteolytica TaxID=2795029 RepID=A0A931J1V4_9BURK|nr:methyl-accepting chemotaxis protein [Inhella proteolytica]MBH9576148.1 HAMP domain-containing protein [Inhella proteolytica]
MQFLSNLTVATRQMLVAVAASLAVLACAVVGLLGTRALAGHSEKAFVAKDVVADILPPPMYLIETRLVLSQAVEGSLPAAEAHKELQRLQGEYEARVQHWTAKPPFGLERQLLGAQHERAQAFLKGAQQLLDVLGEPEKAKAQLAEVHTLYQAHRAAVDETVQAANALAGEAMSAYDAGTRSAQRSLVLILVIGVLVMAALAWQVSRSILRPLNLAVKVTERVAAGDLSEDVPGQGPGELGQLMRALGQMDESLQRIVGAVRLSADSIATGAAEIAQGNADLSHRTEQQAANLEQTASSMSGLAESTRHNAEIARTASQLAGAASQVARNGGEVVARVVSTMDEISTSSRRINDIIGVIDGIAFQTNILALNAAVEAARAGEQGRGFAVVASEVRALAGRSAEAAKEIKNLIGQSVARVDQGNRLVAEAGSTMQEIVAQVRRVADLIGEIDSASQEQAQGIGKVGDAVTQIDQSTQQNASLVEQAAAAADSLRQQAVQLTELVAVFRLKA